MTAMAGAHVFAQCRCDCREGVGLQKGDSKARRPLSARSFRSCRSSSGKTFSQAGRNVRFPAHRLQLGSGVRGLFDLSSAICSIQVSKEEAVVILLQIRYDQRMNLFVRLLSKLSRPHGQLQEKPQQGKTAGLRTKGPGFSSGGGKFW